MDDRRLTRTAARTRLTTASGNSPAAVRWWARAAIPLSAILQLKRVEGEAHDGKAIRPATVSARTHEITRIKGYRDAGFLRTTYDDIEDYGQVHVTFDDGTVADIFSSELVLGGVHSWMEVFANNHRTRCNLNPIDALETYNPREDIFKDVYLTEKLGTKQGWSHPAPDEDWQHGYPQEFQDFMDSFAANRPPLSSGELARDTMVVLYSAYLSAERRGAEVEIPFPVINGVGAASEPWGTVRRDRSAWPKSRRATGYGAMTAGSQLFHVDANLISSVSAGAQPMAGQFLSLLFPIYVLLWNRGGNHDVAMSLFSRIEGPIAENGIGMPTCCFRWSHGSDLPLCAVSLALSRRGVQAMGRERGFSLIELLIVVAIILIIAAIAIPNFMRSRVAANQASAMQSMRIISTA